MKKTLITGTGRAGTTFLMHLLTAVGENTGFALREVESELKKNGPLNAGVEHGFMSPRYQRAKYIKNPQFAIIENFKQVQPHIDKVITPIRELGATAKSREYMDRVTHGNYGGYWLGARNPEEQKTENAKLIYKLTQYLETQGIKHVFISFEKMRIDPVYLYRKLELSVGFLAFEEAFKSIVDPNKIRF